MATSASPDEIIRKIRAEAVRQGLKDPDLAVTVVIKESSLNPDAIGDNGKSVGLFQLQPGAAKAVGLSPQDRYDVDKNIFGGVKYLRQQLEAEGGNVPRALGRYNWGTPTYRGIGTASYVENALKLRRDLEHPETFRRFRAVETAPLGSVASRIESPGRVTPTPATAASTPLTAADLRARLPERPSLTQRLAAWMSPQAAEAGGTSLAPGQIDWQKELLGTPAPSAPAAPTPAVSAPAAPAVDTSGTVPWGPGASTTLPAPGAPAAPGAVMPWDPGVSTTLPATPPGRPAGPEDVTLLGQPPPAAPVPAAPSGIDWHQELLGTPRPPVVPQAPQAHPAVGRSAQILGQVGIIPTNQLVEGRLPTTLEIARQRGKEASNTGIGANVGEVLGQVGGTMIAPGPGTVAGGTFGAMTGQAVEDLLRGRPFDPVGIAWEGALSLAPEALESTLRPIGRAALRAIPAGQAIRFDEAARRARQMAGYTFQPQTREQVGEAFEQVRQSGVRLDIGAVTQEVQRQTPGKYADLMAEVRLIDNAHRTGGRYQRLVESLRNPQPGARTVGWDIGDLQQLRSALRERLEGVEPAEARQLLGDFQGSVDRSIETGLARGRVPAGTTPETLLEARRQWGRLRSAEDMTALIEAKIRSSPNLEMVRFPLNSFMDEVRRDRTGLARSINRGLEHTPGARERFTHGMQEIARLYDTIELPMTDVSGIRRHWAVAAVGQMLSTIMVTDAGRAAFRQAVTDGRGQLSLNAVAAAANAGRRELNLPLFEPPGERPDGATAAPGSTAPPASPPAPAPAVGTLQQRYAPPVGTLQQTYAP